MVSLSTRLLLSSVVVTAACCCCSRGVLGASAPAVQPNFVFYFPDETRAESLGTYGHRLTATPSFDRLASRGVLFEQAHVLHTQCSPSRCAMLTGRYLHTLGHRTQQHLIQRTESNLFSYLREAGYFVGWFGKNDALSADSFADSVDMWESYSEKDVLAFIDSPPTDGKPYMLFIPTKGAHPPYQCGGGGGFSFGTAGYYSFWDNSTSSYDPAEIEEKAPLRPAGMKNKPEYFTAIPEYRNLTSLDENFFLSINACYLQMVEAVDTTLGRIIDAVDNSSAANSTVIVASSDHGDFAGDAHLVEKWPGGLDDMLTRVPLVASLPAALGGVENHTVRAPVQLFDLLPTFAELGGAHINHTHFAISLVPMLRGGGGDMGRMVYSEAGYLFPTEIEPLHSGGGTPGPDGDKTNLYYPRGMEEMEGCNVTDPLLNPNYRGCLGSPRAVMARNTTHKIIYRPDGVGELYDMLTDPRELCNLWDDADWAFTRDAMLLDLLRWMVETSDVTPLAVDNRGLPPTTDCGETH